MPDNATQCYVRNRKREEWSWVREVAGWEDDYLLKHPADIAGIVADAVNHGAGIDKVEVVLEKECKAVLRFMNSRGC